MSGLEPSFLFLSIPSCSPERPAQENRKRAFRGLEQATGATERILEVLAHRQSADVNPEIRGLVLVQARSSSQSLTRDLPQKGNANNGTVVMLRGSCAVPIVSLFNFRLRILSRTSSLICRRIRTSDLPRSGACQPFGVLARCSGALRESGGPSTGSCPEAWVFQSLVIWQLLLVLQWTGANTALRS